MKIFAAIVALRLLLQVWFFAPHLGDALAYHLPKIAEWVQNGRFTREMGLHPHVMFPAGFELIETWWVVFLHHDVLIEMAGVEFLLLAFAGTYALGRRLSLAPKWSFFAGLLYVMTPGLHLSATSCLNDTPVAALVVATFALAAWRTPMAIMLIAVGLGAGVKATYLYALPGVALIWILSRKETHPLSRTSPLSVALAIAAFGIGAFWYGRNLVWFGNPVYPVGSSGYSAEPVAVQAGPRLISFIANASDLVNTRIYDNQGAYGANVDNIAGWGAPAFACGLLALLVAFLDDPPTRRIALGFLLSLAICFLLMIHDPWCLKYVFFFPAVLAVASVRFAVQQRPVFVFMTLALAFDFIATMLPYDLPMHMLNALARQSWETRSALLPSDSTIPRNRIGCFGGYKAKSYSLYGPNFRRNVSYLRPKSGTEFMLLLRGLELRQVYSVPTCDKDAETLRTAIEHGFLRNVKGQVFEVRNIFPP